MNEATDIARYSVAGNGEAEVDVPVELISAQVGPEGPTGVCCTLPPGMVSCEMTFASALMP